MNVRQVLDQADEAHERTEYELSSKLAHSVLDFAPNNPRALRIAVQALASLGNARAILAILNANEIRGQARLESIRRAVRIAKKAGQVDCGLLLSKQLLRGIERDPTLLSEIAGVVLETDNASIVDELLHSLTRLEDRAAIGAMWAAQGGSLAEALVHLEKVPPAHPLRLRAVRLSQYVARKELNQPEIYRLGMELFTAGDDIRLPIWLTWQAACLQGCLENAQAVFLRGERESQYVLTNDEAFERSWKGAVHWFMNAFNVDDGIRAIDRAFERGLTTDAEHPTRSEVRDFVAEFGPELRAARTTMRALTFEDAAEFPEHEFVRIVSRPKIVNVGNHKNAETDKGWLRLVTEIGRQARKVGGTIGFVHEAQQDAAVRIASPPQALSYHTEGYSPGTLHFKEADLPRYFSIDTHGYSGWSSLAGSSVEGLPLGDLPAADVEEFFESTRRHMLQTHYSKYVQSANVDHGPLPDRFVFVALQILGDRVQSLARVPMLQMLDIVVRRFAGMDRAVVVKRHPLCQNRHVSDVLAALSASKKILLRNDSIHDLISNADAVITVNSGVRSEAAIHLKPVYIFGAAEYAPIAHSISDEADFVRKTNPIELPVSADMIKRFVYFYRNRWLVDTQDARSLQAAVASRVFKSESAAAGQKV